MECEPECFFSPKNPWSLHGWALHEGPDPDPFGEGLEFLG